MSTPSDHLSFQFSELNALNDALRDLERAGLGPLSDVYQAVYQARGAALSKLGLNIPRTTTFLTTLLGLSPGKANLFIDAELGWLVEALETPNSQPVRRYVPFETALKIIRHELTHQEFISLLEPEPGYIA